MKVLIIGASSFIGKNLLEELTEGSYRVSAVTATYLNDLTFPAFAQKLGVHALQHDLLNSEPIHNEYDVCLYLAGNSNHGAAIKEPLTDLALNTQSCLRFLQHARCKRVIYLSSGAVYYGLKGFVDPQTAVNPVFTYGISKLASEHYTRAYHYMQQLSSYAIFRLFYAYGKYDKPRRLIPQVTRALLAEGRNHFTINGTGQSLMNPLDARYVAHALAQAALSNTVSGTFDLCGEVIDRTVPNIVEEIGQALGKEITVSCDQVPEAFPVEFFGSLASAKAAFSLPSPGSFTDGIRRYAQWMTQ